MSAGARVGAALCLAGVLGGKSLDELMRTHGAALNSLEQSLMKAIAYGAVRDWRLLDALAGRMLQRPLRSEPELYALLLCGLYQLRSMRVPAHAAVAETVAAAEALNKSWGKGLINALLRRYQREREALEAAVPAMPAVQLSYPDWLAAAIAAAWGEAAPAVLAAGNVPGPLTLRVNRRRGSLQDYLARLAEAGLAAAPLPQAADAVVLGEGVPVEQLPGFAEGLVSVQDASAQLAADLLDAQPGERVLDACCAPGGKLAHLLERVDRLQLTALDSDVQRLRRVRENLDRLHLLAQVVAADVTQARDWWDGRPFDRILLDAPCSGTGVIRRHPDIKWLRRERDIPRMAQHQLRLLEALWPLLAPGGTLLYATCSILPAEGEAVLERFLGAHADAREQPIAAGWGEPRSVGRRIEPGGAFDGFYYGRIGKASA